MHNRHPGISLPRWLSHQICSPVGIFDGKEIFHGAHVEGFPKPAGTGGQGNFVRIFPPIPEEQGFVYIKNIFSIISA